MYALIFIYFEGGINVKKRLTRTISVLLALIMVFGVLSVSFVSAGAVTVVKTKVVDSLVSEQAMEATLNVGEAVDVKFVEKIPAGTLRIRNATYILLNEYYNMVSIKSSPDSSVWASNIKLNGPETFTITALKPGRAVVHFSMSYYLTKAGADDKMHTDSEGDVFVSIFLNIKGSGSSSTPSVNKAKPSLTVANKGNSLRTQWNAISGASSYQVFYKTASSGWSSTTVSGTSYNYQGTPGTLYYFQVIPMFNGTRGTPSNVVSCTYVRNTTLRSTAYNSNGTVTVGWDSAAGANGYAVAKKKPTDKSYTYYYVSGTSFNDRNVVGGAQYVYQIRPYYSNGKSAAYSDWSNSKTITTLFRPTITNINTNNINLLNINWNAIKGAKGYKVAFKRSYDSAWNYRTTNSRYYNVQNPTRGATYQVQVCAISGNLAGAYSAVSSHTVGPALTKPTLTGTTNNVSGNLSWNAVNGATGYQIARKRGDQSSYSYFTTTSTSYFDSSLIKGKLYAYQVRAYSGSTFGPWSNVMTLRPIVDKPNVYLLEKYSSWIQAEWYNVPNAASYKVAYYKKGDSDWTYVDIDETEFDLYYPVSNSYYVFSFCAVGENGRWSEWTDSQRIYT